jgi:hypothetical protein
MALIKRKSERKRVTQPARIYASDRAFICNCVVQDLSDGGGRLKIYGDDDGNLPDIPPEFILSFVADESELNDFFSVTRNCRVVWTKGDEIGVQFLRSSRQKLPGDEGAARLLRFMESGGRNGK